MGSGSTDQVIIQSWNHRISGRYCSWGKSGRAWGQRMAFLGALLNAPKSLSTFLGAFRSRRHGRTASNQSTRIYCLFWSLEGEPHD